ncbi:uncharacterized protein LOC120351570 [Nilaparvata lugens]|uniref:uncharacterized protein LOC120351570 n=1 Tax=Nilaparvata lugens TaxID=108931 RepID=UPI00193DE543|nr:uncharacterized protein LOC120351570 [Nilaparvata lugens]
MPSRHTIIGSAQITQCKSNRLTILEGTINLLSYMVHCIHCQYPNSEAKLHKCQIVDEIKLRRLSWLGHVERMSDSRIVKKVFRNNPGGRLRGRPRKRWLEDIRKLGVRGWRRKAVDRDEWRGFLNEVKALNEL